MRYKLLFGILLSCFIVACGSHSYGQSTKVKNSFDQKAENEIDYNKKWEAKNTATSPKQLIDQVRKHISNVTLAEIDKPISFAGHYTSGVGLSGEELYLFPDGTYMYTEWSDITPEILNDRGNWSFSDGFLQLISDKTIKNESLKDKLYVGLFYDGKTQLKRHIGDEDDSGLVLMGANWSYSMYIDFIQSDIDEGWDEQEEFDRSFLTCTLKKIEDIKLQDVGIINKSWWESVVEKLDKR